MCCVRVVCVLCERCVCVCVCCVRVVIASVCIVKSKQKLPKQWELRHNGFNNESYETPPSFHW